jgi:hypothetical protein
VIWFGLHDVEVDVGRDARDFQDLVEHLAVLRGDADAGVEVPAFSRRA